MIDLNQINVSEYHTTVQNKPAAGTSRKAPGYDGVR